MNRLPDLEDSIVRHDAEWFWKNGFIDGVLYWKVISWLGGIDDREAQLVVASWMDRDIEWISNIESPAARKFWYMFPVIKLEANIIKDMLSSRAKLLREEFQYEILHN